MNVTDNSCELIPTDKLVTFNANQTINSNKILSFTAHCIFVFSQTNGTHMCGIFARFVRVFSEMFGYRYYNIYYIYKDFLILMF